MKPEDSYWYFCDPDLPLCGAYSYSEEQQQEESEYDEVSLSHTEALSPEIVKEILIL